jgi:hypothetical protein
MVSLQFSLPGVESPGGEIAVAARREEIAAVRDAPIILFIEFGFLFVNHDPSEVALWDCLEPLYYPQQNGL